MKNLSWQIMGKGENTHKKTHKRIEEIHSCDIGSQRCELSNPTQPPYESLMNVFQNSSSL